MARTVFNSRLMTSVPGADPVGLALALISGVVPVMVLVVDL